MRRARASGQAAVELVAVLPLLAVGLLALAQALLAAHAAWAAEQAAHAAARAHAVEGAALRHAARSALPGHLEGGLRVDARADGTVAVRIAVPRLLGPLDLGTLTARAHFEGQR